MTNDQATAEPTQPEESAPVPAPDADWFLQALVAMANDRFLEFPVTLHVKGVTITGIVMGGRAFFERWADEYAGGVSFEGGTSKENEAGRQSLRSMFASFGEIYPDKTLTEREEAGETLGPSPQANYIHLRDARFFLGSAFVPTNRPVLWRGRIGEVDGFVLGTLSAP